MCGFVGVFNYLSKNPIDKKLVHAMNSLIQHRGPDSEGYFFNSNFGLGFRRLSIIDVSSSGDQPILSKDGRWSLVFNGEIYNYKELKELLKSRGYVFRSESDSEVILALYELNYDQPETLLDGMFAFAIFDREENTLTLSRDRLGKKPLFYSITKQGVIFASEIKSILLNDDIDKKVNWNSVSDYFTLGYLPRNETAIQGIYLLEAGKKLIFSCETISSQTWWTLKPLPEAKKIYTQDLNEQVYESISESIKKRLIADVPIGIFLSGGIDSALIASIVKSLGAPKDFKAYTIGFDSKSYDESNTASKIANILEIPHEIIIMTPRDFSENFSDIVYKSDNLLGNPAIFANYLLSKKCKGEIKVALNGGGGDELFFGYETYKANFLASKIPPLPKVVVASLLSLLSFFRTTHKKLGFKYKIFKFIEGLEFSSAKRHYWWRTIFTESDKEKLFVNRPLTDSFAAYQESFNTFSGDDFHEASSFSDLKVWWEHMGLYQGDAMSMANSIELRLPFMDYKLVEKVFSLPRIQKFSGKKLKPILRNISLNILPKEISNLPKSGFHLPLAEWYTSELKEFVIEKLSKNNIEKIPNLNYPEIKIILHDHFNKKFDNSFKITLLLVFVEWHNIFIQKKPHRKEQ